LISSEPDALRALLDRVLRDGRAREVEHDFLDGDDEYQASSIAHQVETILREAKDDEKAQPVNLWRVCEATHPVCVTENGALREIHCSAEAQLDALRTFIRKAALNSSDHGYDASIDGRLFPNTDRNADRLAMWQGSVPAEQENDVGELTLTESAYLDQLEDLPVEPVTIGQGGVLWRHVRQFSCTSTTAGNFIRFLGHELRQGEVAQQFAEDITGLLAFLRRSRSFHRKHSLKK
jgi:hypothetical protein